MKSHREGANRRTFLKTSGGAAAAVALSGVPLRARQDKLRIAVIGCGGRGGANLKGVSSEHIAVLWKRLYDTPVLWTRERVGVRTSPPNVSGRPGPASSIRMMTMFGASGASRLGSCRHL